MTVVEILLLEKLENVPEVLERHLGGVVEVV
jgi:hypothetical protein